ncbi:MULTISPECIES: aromatic acid/H+ symport family MFS transporter [unclassified Rhodococcus (in: high G+C Gram-positive bacteria)]|nr:aromatic acid/H+ symport family MFS transporter [Rhodococcus sp. M8]QPG43569.1 hypothetical protein ISO16_16520 [Rhodococcus sp. M8]
MSRCSSRKREPTRVLQAGVAYPWGFYAFAAVGVLGALALSTSRPVR